MVRGRLAFGWGIGALALAAALLIVLPAAARADRYPEVGGCFTLTSAGSGTPATGGTQLR